MRTRFILPLLLLVSAGAVARDAATDTTSWTRLTVSMEIREPDGTSKKYSDVPWTLGMTVLDTMQTVDGFKFTAEWYRSLSDWLIVSIDGAANQGQGKPNWMYCVNGSPAGVGVSSYRLGPNASIVWVYDSAYPPKC